MFKNGEIVALALFLSLPASVVVYLPVNETDVINSDTYFLYHVCISVSQEKEREKGKEKEKRKIKSSKTYLKTQ